MKTFFVFFVVLLCVLWACASIKDCSDAHDAGMTYGEYVVKQDKERQDAEDKKWLEGAAERERVHRDAQAVKDGINPFK